MNIHQEILREHSKANVDKIVNYIGADEELFAELIKLFLKGDSRTTQRTSWILSECAAKYPFQIKPYFKDFLEKINEPNLHESVRRNIVRNWQFVEIPEEYLGEIYDICFRYLSENQPIATIVFSMTVCHNITTRIPELKIELRFRIEDLLLKHQYGSAAIKSRGSKILAKLKKK